MSGKSCEYEIAELTRQNDMGLESAHFLKEVCAFKPHIVLASQFGDLIFATFAGHLCRAFVLGGVRSDGFYELRTSGRRAWFLLNFTHGLIANSHRARDK